MSGLWLEDFWLFSPIANRFLWFLTLWLLILLLLKLLLLGEHLSVILAFLDLRVRLLLGILLQFLFLLELRRLLDFFWFYVLDLSDWVCLILIRTPFLWILLFWSLLPSLQNLKCWLILLCDRVALGLVQILLGLWLVYNLLHRLLDEVFLLKVWVSLLFLKLSSFLLVLSLLILRLLLVLRILRVFLVVLLFIVISFAFGNILLILRFPLLIVYLPVLFSIVF